MPFRIKQEIDKMPNQFMLLNLPNPPRRNILRGYAGGFGTSGSLSAEILLPIYLLYGISAFKNAGCEFSVLDAQAKKYDYLQTLIAFEKEKPDILITWLSLPSLYNDLEVLKKIKNSHPNTIIIAMGSVCNVMPEEILRNHSVDIIIQGRYPYYNAVASLISASCILTDKSTFSEIPGAMYINDENMLVKSQIEPRDETLDELVLDAYKLLPVKAYIGETEEINGKVIRYIPIVTSVGCPYSCIYCPYPIGFGKKIEYKSIEVIISEIEYLKKEFGINGFLFRDQVFTQNKERVERLCRELSRKGLEIKWFVETRADLVDQELLFKMKDAGCFRIHYGVETGDQELLEKVGKPRLDVETIKETFRLTKRAGIATHAHVIIGLPGENSNTLQRTYDLICELNPDSVSWNIATPYPGTKMFEMACENGWISTYDWSNYTSDMPVMRTKELTIEQLAEARREMRRKFRRFKLLSDPNPRKYMKKMLKKIVKYKPM